jgi:hypothetical protein
LRNGISLGKSFERGIFLFAQLYIGFYYYTTNRGSHFRYARSTGAMLVWYESVFNSLALLIASIAIAIGVLFSPQANIMGGGLISQS